ncbi:MAG: DUF1015 domain-containing protein [Nanoarchaeota archaeon]|nr:DUF1015 domain-containing protein [Nanoarchaeota archaeon]MBU1005286.1 DUF1015 domain-containing protein [Nanoarchaeota archaeon]MBU1946217.1 DUF1015 domain-containing protein [Nanoarchaeota archaeon]
MVEIKAFKGLRYNKQKVKDFGLVITPPYDVISEKERDEFAKFSDFNMVNLLLPGEEKDDYKKAADNLREWVENGVLEREKEDSVYIYSQTFSYNNRLFTRTGFISLIKLEELGKGVLPHEKTLNKPFQDRLTLLNETKANLGLVFMLYDDRQKVIDGFIKEKVNGSKPDIEFEDNKKIVNKLWKISDAGFISMIKKEMVQYQCIIADGHHRYKSVLKFREEHPEMEDAKYAMCCFINSFNEGLFVLPIDRFVFNLEGVDVDGVLGKIGKYFEINEAGDVKELIKKVDDTDILIDKASNLKNHVFGMYCFLNKKSYFLKLKNNNVLDEHYPDKTDVYRKLDINILHKIIFNDILGISEEEQAKGTYIEYTKGNKRALEKLDDDKYQFAFFINAPLMREIFLTARANETMPQKSTYFYPKAYSGMVINKMER